MSELLAATLLVIASAACGDNIDTLDRAEACAEQAAAWCAAVDATDGASAGPACAPWYESRCHGDEPVDLVDHLACLDALATFELEASGPLVPLECLELWPASD